MTKRYNPPPNWPTPPNGWTPPAGWEPDPSWGPPPAGWQVWTDAPAGGGLSTGAKVGLGVLAAFVGLCAVGGIGAAMSGDTPETDPVAVTSSASASASPTTESPEDAAQAAAEKAAADKAAEEKAAADKAAADKAAADKAAADKAAADKAAADKAAADKAAADKAAADAAAAAAAEAAKGSFAQQNAYESAVSYLDFAAFSRSGLLQQLSSEYGEGYVLADAEFAIARLEAEGGVDWNAEAAESAKSYLSMTSFSRQGLLEQLTSEYGEGFTPEQAEYGVSQAGL